MASDEAFWREIRDEFTLDPEVLNLNNGGVHPSPKCVQDAVKRSLDIANLATAYRLWEELEPKIEGVRTRLASMFGCDPEELAITRNSSEALETCLLGIDLAPGDEVLTTTQDYPRMRATLRQRQRRDGIAVREIELPVPGGDPEEVVEAFDRGIGPRTRAILVSHVINITGRVLPVKQVCRLARDRGVETIVDGAHAFTHFPFKWSDVECDYYGSSLHKWAMAPHGTGFLFVRREKIEKLWPLMACEEEQISNIRKFEEFGTHPAAPHNAIGDALDFQERLGIERKFARLKLLRSRWQSRLLELPGVYTLTPLDAVQSCGLATIGFRDHDPEKLSATLFERHKILVNPVKTEQFEGIRVTPSVYTSLEEIDRFCEALENLVLKS